MLRLAAAVLVVAGSATVAASASLTPPRFTVDAELRAAQTEAAAAEAEQRRLEKAASEARDDAARLRARQLAAAQAVSAAEAQITAADARARLVNAQVELQRIRLAREQAPVSSLLAGLALMARRPPVLLLADGNSPDELVKLRLLIRATRPAIAERTAALSGELERARRLREAQVDARNAIARSRAELVRRRDTFAALEARALASAGENGSAALGAGDVALVRQEQLAGIRESAGAGRSSAAAARELASLGPAPLPRAGAAAEPPIEYRLPARAAVVDGLGSVSANGVRSRGITLATRRGTVVVAPAAGTIAFAGPFREYDGIVIIDHGGGWKTVLVNAGSKLRRGDRIAIGEELGVALGPLEVQLQKGAELYSPALIAGSSQILSNRRKGG